MEPVRVLDPGPDTAGARWGPVTFAGPGHVEALRGPRGPRRSSQGTGHRVEYAPGLDGVRALAVAAVVAYHLGASWLPGGFLGVDVFFVLSGYLITSLLYTEVLNSADRENGARGRIDLRRFYLRRARRLLPALFAMFAAVTFVCTVAVRDQLPRLRGDVVAALTYCTNWTQIAWNRSYFAQLGRPSLLQHLWSLAVEEQFYLLWPLVLLACVATRRRSAALVTTLALTVLSTVRMALLYSPSTDPARVYYGTDTHLSPMLVGAAVAVVVVQRRRVGIATGGRGLHRLDVAAFAGFVALAVAVGALGYESGFLYRGGYLLIAAAAAALVVGAGTNGTVTARALSVRPLLWLGTRSYAVYLWHWPILQLTDGRIGLRGTPLVVLQLALTVGAADLSYRHLEQPIRQRGLLAFLRGGNEPRTRGRQGRQGRRLRARTIGSALGTCVVAALLVAPGGASGVEVDHSRNLTVHVAVGAPSLGRAFGRPVRVAFFGDSQGMTLLLNRPAGLASSMALSDATVEGCSVLDGTIHSRVGYTRDLGSGCADWPTLWAQRARRDRPQIAVVEVGAWDVFDDTVGGRTLAFGTPAWDAHYRAQLEKGIGILVGAGAQVALLGVPCYRPIAAGGLPLLPERGDDARTRHVSALLQRAAAADPRRVFYIRPPAQFCSPPIASDTSYRWDGTHFYKPGAALEFRVITPQLLRIPPPPRR